MSYQPTTQMNITIAPNPGVSRPWKYAIMTSCFPCITYGQNKAALNPGDSCCCNSFIYCALECCFLWWIPAASTRGAIRARYNIEGSGCGDCMAHICCPCCALVQEARELRELRWWSTISSISSGVPPAGEGYLLIGFGFDGVVGIGDLDPPYLTDQIPCHVISTWKRRITTHTRYTRLI
ncbi:9298_t:CDS:2 [Diversispora eburnea]|uniref:9298_t:CDS:1 n=1 Tax=Diversispora eburnea TaxID=1213867 RepID=A0A9N9A1P1_9GLOM|nr:9298_t:CDS:2 [Diversispora eburnea]